MLSLATVHAKSKYKVRSAFAYILFYFVLLIWFLKKVMSGLVLQSGKGARLKHHRVGEKDG